MGEQGLERSTETPVRPPLDDRLADVIGSLNVLHGELVGLIAEAAALGEWSDGTARSLEHWVCWQAGCSSSTARQLVALVTARESHPRVSALLAAGELTVDQAAAAVKVRAECDEVMAALAPLSTVAQIRTEVRLANSATATAPPPDAGVDHNGDAVGDEPAAGGVDEVVAQGFDRDRWWMSANLSGERGALVRAALEEARDRLFRHGHHDVTWADALVEIAARSLAAAPDGRRDLYRVNVFLPLDGPVTLPDRTALPDCVARHLTCDGMLSPVFTEDAVPIGVGRTQRIVPERTRRVVAHRDGGVCRNPLCGSRFGLEIHHIVHWFDGGATDPDNLLTLCAACHRLHHRHRLGITGNADMADGVAFTDARGRPLRRPRANPPPALPTPVKRYRRPLGEPLDLDALGDIFPAPVTGN